MRLTENFVAGTAIGFSIPGDYFYLDSVPAGLVTAQFFRNGQRLLDDLTSVIAGWHASPIGGFDRVEIASTVTQALSFYISRGAVGNILVARPVWSDRNPVTITRTYSAGGVAPHAVTQRWIYTVPANKKFNIQLASVFTLRTGAAGPAGVVEALIDFVPAAGATTYIVDLTTIDAAVNSGKNFSLGANAVALAGDAIRGYTADPSTGGTNLYNLSLQGLEFDA
jgi:hypothetical protein